jgi:hypothetical protein
MITKSYTISRDDIIPLSSFFDEFNIESCDIDLFKLTISVDLDFSCVFYEGEDPDICVVIKYDN